MTYIAPLHDELGRPSGSMAVIADITERKQVEEALRESEERFRTAFDEAAVGMAITGLDGNFRRVNRALCDIVGYSAEELLQMRFHEITHRDDREDNVAALQAFVECGARVLRRPELHGGHVVLNLATLQGRVTLAGGTGRFAGFEADVVVSLDASGVWHWDGTYSFAPPGEA